VSGSEAMTYAEYIQTFFAGDVRARCESATRAMLEVFPELRRVRGFYYDAMWGARTHWWCVAPDGSIVDPTSRQFPSQGAGHYQEWREGDEEPSGRCLGCGDYIFESRRGGSFVCGPACEWEVARYLGF
jgi:hypothetical protein